MPVEPVERTIQLNCPGLAVSPATTSCSTPFGGGDWPVEMAMFVIKNSIAKQRFMVFALLKRQRKSRAVLVQRSAPYERLISLELKLLGKKPLKRAPIRDIACVAVR